MKPNHLFAIMAVCLAAAGLSQLNLLPTITPPPANPGAPDLLAAFRETDNYAGAAADAHRFAELCGSMAAAIEYDAAKPEPQLRTATQLANLRIIARDTMLGGGSFGSHYPRLGGDVKAFMDQRVGVNGGALTDEKRRDYASAYRQLENSGRYAADYLTWKS